MRFRKYMVVLAVGSATLLSIELYNFVTTGDSRRYHDRPWLKQYPDTFLRRTFSRAEPTEEMRARRPKEALAAIEAARATAENAMQTGKYQEAISAATNILVNHPSPSERYFAYTITGDAYVKQRIYNPATHAYGSAIVLPGLTAEQRNQTLMRLIETEFAVGDYRDATEAAEVYSNDMGSNEAIYMMVAKAYYLDNDFDGAASTVRHLAEQDDLPYPPSEDLLKLWLQAEEKRANAAGTISALTHLMKSYPKDEYRQRIDAEKR